MPALVRLKNDNTHDFKSYYKGEEVFIKAKDYWRDEAGNPKEVDIYEAADFRGTYHQPKNQADGTPDPKSFKIILIEKVADSAPELESHVCMQCKHKSPSAHELDAHLKFVHADAERVVIPEMDAKQKVTRKTAVPA